MLELPANDVAPLVDLQWEVTMRLDPLGEGRIHDGFAGWTEGDRFRQIRVARLRHPGDL